MVPITFLLADAFDIDPIPLILIEVMACNIGGAATLIGDPPNIMIGAATGLSFIEFLVNMAPIAYLTVIAGGRACSTSPSGAGCRSRRGVARPRDGARRAPLDRGPGRAAPAGAAAAADDPRVLRPQAARRSSRRRSRWPARRRCCWSRASRSTTTLGGIEWPTLFFFARPVRDGRRARAHRRDRRAGARRSSRSTDGDRTAELLGIAWVGGDRRRHRRQHPADRDDDPRRRRRSPATPATTPTGGRSRSAPASAAT